MSLVHPPLPLRTAVAASTALATLVALPLVAVPAPADDAERAVAEFAVTGLDAVQPDGSAEVAIEVDVIDPGPLEPDERVRVLGDLSGPGAADVEAVSLEDDGEVALTVDDGRFLMPSAGAAPTVSDLDGAELDVRLEELPTEGGELALTLALVRGEASAPEATRLSGADRYATAVEISKSAHPDPGEVDTVVVSLGDDFPDALAGVPAAGDAQGPLLLTDGAWLPRVTRDEITRLGPDRALVLGGTQAISETVAGQIRDLGVEVERLAGDNRYATAAEVARATFDDPSVVFVASGESFPDALSAGPAAIGEQAPMLLTRPTALPEDTAAALDDLSASAAVVVGGPAAVSDDVLAAVDERVRVGTRRIAGEDRYETSAKIAERFHDGNGVEDLVLATGADFADALSGGPAAAALGAPLLLAQRDAIPATVTQAMEGFNAPRHWLLGGEQALGGAVVSLAAATVSTDPPGPGDATPVSDPVTEAAEVGDDDRDLTRYEVQPGDTLSSIAREFDVSVTVLVELNDLDDPDVLRAGDELLVPDPDADDDGDDDGDDPDLGPVEDPEVKIHVVSSGETLIGLARRYDTTEAVLLELNPDLENPNVLEVGQRLTVPVPEGG